MTAPAALVMAKAPRPGEVKTRLQPLLGAEGCARLQAALLRRAAGWAHAVAPGAAFVAFAPEDGLEETLDLVPAGTDLFAQEGTDLGQRLAAAIARVLVLHPGPLLVVGTDLATLSAEHARAALEDLADGCDVCFGPAFDGGYYLVALSAPHPCLFDLPSAAWGGPEVLELSLQAAATAELSLGLLRGERDLDTPADARAALADPQFPEDIAAMLR
ncbi:MAG: TIGR04282 family arsenosugar biosynthesis glycosyltransferase [Actinomycetota bacterium]|nr:TIGR04282 family arsenosugar biosynthesis glycosyltransferase [Actinomycetota bacterium]